MEVVMFENKPNFNFFTSSIFVLYFRNKIHQITDMVSDFPRN